MKLIFQGIAIAGLADNAASSPITTLYLSLHTADPLDTALSGQSTNETTYTGYARVVVARFAGGWSVAANVGSNASAVGFPAATGGSNTLTHFGIGTSASGAGKLLLSGALTSSLAVSAGITPSFASGQLTVNAD